MREDEIGGVPTPPVLKLVNIYKYFYGVTALAGINFEVNKNEIVGLIGDNGAGKSTLIKTIMGFHKPDIGEIYFNSKKIKDWSVHKARGLGIEAVYQERALAEQLNLWRNIFMGREITNNFGFIKIRELREHTENIMRKYMGFTSKAISPDSMVKTMSGGEKQGVAIARALYFQAEIVILDEPTTALSLSETGKVFNFIEGIKKEGKSAIMISHNIYHVYPVADRFVIIDRGRIMGEFKKAEITLDDLVEKLHKVADTGHLS